MSIVLKIPVDADSAFAHTLVSVLDELVKKDRGLIPENNASAWYEHLVSEDSEGKVSAEAFVLLITPSENSEKGRDKWNTITSAVREVISDGSKTHSLMEGLAVSHSDISESKISFSS